VPEVAAAALPSTRPRFPLAVQSYFWLVSSLLGLSPVGIVSSIASREDVPLRWWIASILWPVLLAVLFWYAARRCSSDKMRFTDGLLWVTRSAIGGSMFMSIILVTLALLAAFLGAILLAIYSDLIRQPRFAPVKWAQLILFFHRNRMRR
jgi:NADH:ubiquinone oxidoreductase subunit 4 (subunit M)